jgi:hypothetical protein
LALEGKKADCDDVHHAAILVGSCVLALRAVIKAVTALRRALVW